MTHRPTPRRRRIVALPPGLRPKLSKSQVRDLGLAHIANLDLISRGEATEEVLWQWIGGAMMWGYVAETLQRRSPETYKEAAESMQLQLVVAKSMLARHRRTGRVGFSGPEYQQAKNACEWMDALAAVVDHTTALRAAEMSVPSTEKWAARHAQRDGQAKHGTPT